MEGSADVHEYVENTAEIPQIKRKEDDLPQQQSENCIQLQNQASVIRERIDWTEHLSSLSSPEKLLETLAGKDINFGSGAHSFMDPPTSSSPSNFTGTAMEEPAMKSFNSTNASSNVCSGIGETYPIRKGFWQNFTRIAGGPRINLLHKDSFRACDRVNVSRTDDPESLLKKPLAFSHYNINFPRTNEDRKEEHNQFLSRKCVAEHSPGIRTKDLPALGFQQPVLKSNLKGKGVAYVHQGTINFPREIAQSQSNIMTNSKSLHKQIKKADEMTLVSRDSGPADLRAIGRGSSLREWIIQKQNNYNRLERLHVFKQTLELVDTSHSEGVVLQHLRPSDFVVSSTGVVKYMGSFSALRKASDLTVSTNEDITLESHMKRMRSVEQDSEFQTLQSQKHLKICDVQELHGMPASNYPGYGKKSEAVVQQRMHPSRSFLEGGLIEGIHDVNIKRNSSDFGICEDHKLVEPNLGLKILGGTTISLSDCHEPDSRFLNLEDKWYTSPEEMNGIACQLSSNIYSLGVLFFELLCYFETQLLHYTAMSNLRHRILPPRFLSGFSNEASFCLWLLHPDPSSRPKAREVLSSNLMSECNNVSATDQLLASIGEEDAEADLLLHFLSSLRDQTENQSAKLVADIQCLEADIKEVEKRRLSRVMSFSNSRNMLASHVDDFNLHEVPFQIGSSTSWSVTTLNEERLMKNIDQLEHAYFSMRSSIELSEPNAARRLDVDILKVRDNMCQLQDEAGILEEPRDRIGTFFEGLSKYARYSKFEVRGSLRNGDILNSANVICSLSFDRDENYFAAAGVSRKIKIFEFGSLLNETVDAHYPLIEMSSRSKLSCVCWNSYIKNYLASTDYDGVVQLWDASTGQAFAQYAEHEKRAWSVDFSSVDPTKLVSGSDDCSVKLWSIKERTCIDTIKNVANVCCVQFSHHSSHLLSFGSADYKIYCYDLRNTRTAWCTLTGHGKAVSYVKFVDSETLVSASTDNTLKLWDLHKSSSSGVSMNACRLTCSGHTNEKNFVGLSVFDGYITCGSETNEVYVYHKAFPMCITSHKFGSVDPITGQEIGDDNGQFVSSVCWRTKSNMVVAANSSGSLKLLQLV